MTLLYIFSVNLACKECEDELVNSDQRLVVEATHLGYKEDELEYTWQVTENSVFLNTGQFCCLCFCRVFFLVLVSFYGYILNVEP